MQKPIGSRDESSPKGLIPEKIVKDSAKKAGMKPHEWLAMIASGEPIEQSFWNIERDSKGVEICREKKTEQLYPSMDVRIDCAKSAAPYYAAKLKEVALTGADGGQLEASIHIHEARAKILSGLDRLSPES